MATIGPVVSEIICLTKIETNGGQTYRHIDRQTDGNEIPMFLYFRSHDTSRKCGLDHKTSLAYAREVKIEQKFR